MAYLNNIYGNAAFVGALAGMMGNRGPAPGTPAAADYAAVCNKAAALAVDVDALIVFDALVTTGAGITQLAITTNTIAANEQWRAGLLQALTTSIMWGRVPSSVTAAGLQATIAAAIFQCWTQGLTKLVTP